MANAGKYGLTPFGLAVKLETIKKGKTLAEVAQEVGTTYNFLYNIMHGLRPGEEYVPRIAKLLDISVEEYVA